MPVVLGVIVIGFALASVGSLAAIGSIRNAERDTNDKGALGVAEAGALQALYRQNKILTTPVLSSARCLVLSASNTLIAGYEGAGGWCNEQSGSVNGGTYRYRVRPDLINETTGLREIRIVSEGALNGETRRVEVDATASTGTPAFGGAQVVALNRLTLQGNPILVASMKTNAGLSIPTSATCVGNVTVGNGQSLSPNSSRCGGSVTQATTTLGPVDMGNVYAVNDNLRLTDGRDFKTQANQVSFTRLRPTDPLSPGTLSLGSQSTITLAGTNYLLCQLKMGAQSKLIVGAGATVRIYFDTPENCGQPSGFKQIDLTGGSRVSTTSGSPADLAFLVAGSDSLTTNISMVGNSGAENQVTVYAPKSIVDIGGTADYRGAVAGKEITIRGSGTITGSSSSLSFTTPVELAYKQTRFTECYGPLVTTGDPGAGC